MKNDSQWWSFYFVRYAMSSVVGAMLVYLILQSTNETKALLFIPDAKELQIAHLILWFAMGTGYCYLASLPILVFHATRFIRLSLFEKKTWLHWLMFLGLLISFLSAWQILNYVNTSTTLQKTVIGLGVLFFVLLMYLQISLLVILNLPKNKFFAVNAIKELAFKRSLNKPEINEYVETYRHLREHGNSFAILLMEIILALILMSAIQIAELSKANYLISINMSINFGYIVFYTLALWVIPGLAVWNWAQELERELWKTAEDMKL